MSKRLLITGANGFVGSHLVESALKKGYEVFAAVRKNSNLDSLKGLDIAYVYPDYFDKEKLVAVLKENAITHIAHVAGTTKARTQADYNKSNAQLSVNLANAALQANKDLKKFVFVSSLAAMGASVNNQLITESSDAHPITFYGESKLLAEQQLSKINSLPLISLRPTAVYGPREKDLLIIIKMIRKGWELYIGKEAQELSFIYVEDLCSAILLSLESEKNGEAYILSDGNNYDRYEFASIAKNILNKKTIKLHISSALVGAGVSSMEKLFPRRNSILNKNKLQELTSGWQCSVDKAKRDLGFQPQYDLQKGLRSTTDWLIANKWI
ncbi:MAG TPA: NAD(P)-dependent oxidoreductase [Arachidicoccus sp.]